MTSFLAWVGVDERGPASVYFAADSRISWGAASTWDHGRKLFACTTSPRLFGYVGDVLFPSIVLGQIVALADAGLILPRQAPPEEQFSAIAAMVRESFAALPAAEQRSFTIVFAVRDGELMASTFHVFSLAWEASAPAGIWTEARVTLPNGSAPLTILGSGGKVVSQWQGHWNATGQGRTSRAVFSAFCDALRSGGDKYSGGAPQLVGMYRKGDSRTFGTIYKGQPFLYGVPVAPQDVSFSESTIEWRNELFERCDTTGANLPGAQRHYAPKGLGPKRRDRAG